MNRSILIVICDFLLVSLLAFSTVDINKVTQEGTPPQMMKMDTATNQVESGKDLAAVMRLALEDEKQRRDILLSELTKSRETVGRQQREIQSGQQQFAVAQTSIQPFRFIDQLPLGLWPEPSRNRHSRRRPAAAAPERPRRRHHCRLRVESPGPARRPGGSRTSVPPPG